MAKLENWFVYNDQYLVGIIYQDETRTYEDGSPIRTSKLKSIDFDNNKAITQNTTYKLGEKRGY